MADKAEKQRAWQRAAMRRLNDRRRDREILDMPEGYITLKEWAHKNGRTLSAAQKIMWRAPGTVPAAKKVRNPNGGVDIWAVPTDTPWPSRDLKR